MQDEKDTDQDGQYQEDVKRLLSMLAQGKLEGCSTLGDLVWFIGEGNRASVQQWFMDNNLPYLRTDIGINRLVKEYETV